MEKELDRPKEAVNKYAISDELFHKIRSRIYLIEEDIILVREIENVSAESVQVQFDRVDELAENLHKFSMIINLNDANRPDAKTRELLNKRFSNLPFNINHISFCVGGNLLIRTAVRFVMYASGNKSYSVCKTQEESLEKCKNAVARQAK